MGEGEGTHGAVAMNDPNPWDVIESLIGTLETPPVCPMCGQSEPETLPPGTYTFTGPLK